ncbi:hypothetical protein Agub_g12328 [Astrephomene gubernaculifera]|uniref:Uncharacterized protein n=1 Tax=Astrephomene gubernaculifera TaxID=47775 RepID=A0AAD3HR83_9CHLO|nr:hypothetical protein Agub_g12328 [Astrephomene gubernaculifera]
MASLATNRNGILFNSSKPRMVLRTGARTGRFKAPVVAAHAASEVVEVATALTKVDATTLLPSLSIRDASEFILEHPVASFSVSVLALFLVPKLVEAFLRYLAAPILIALVAFYSLENPQESATFVTTVLGWVNANPELTSVIVIGLALFGLAPALLAGFGATALIYALLSVSFGTRLPEVREMQGTFGETVSRAQVVSTIATKRVEQLLK